jgi:hypothetical protein
VEQLITAYRPVCRELIAEEHHQLIHDYIPSLAFGPAIGEVANIQE